MTINWYESVIEFDCQHPQTVIFQPSWLIFAQTHFVQIAVKCMHCWLTTSLILLTRATASNILLKNKILLHCCLVLTVQMCFILKFQGNSDLRILNVAAFAVSGYASSEGRHCKPFNPLLGETYEADFPDKGVRFFSEKVSNHLRFTTEQGDST